MEEFLKERFHRSSFLPHQQKIIEQMMGGRDCVAILPTSGGKSLCYQFPAMYLRKCFVIISPLKALMTNQIADLQSKFSIIAYQYSSAIKAAEKATIIANLSKNEDVGVLLYTTPESIHTATLWNCLVLMHKEKRLGGFVFDEAHTIVDYGTFRTQYATINLRAHFPDVPISAFSATLTADTIRTITTQLKMRNVYFERALLNRPNITPIFNYCEGKKRGEQLLNFIRMRTPLTSGIVYCNTEMMCKSVVKTLNAAFGLNFSTEYYGNIEEDDKSAVLAKWIAGTIRVVVATSAFGMGVNKENVRYVVDYDPPKSPTELLQRMGRAGRDGEQAHYLAFCNHSLTFALFSIFSAPECADGIWKVKQIFGKEQGARCARPRMLSYFSDEKVCCAPPFELCSFCGMSDVEKVKLNKEAEAVRRKKRARVGN